MTFSLTSKLLIFQSHIIKFILQHHFFSLIIVTVKMVNPIVYESIYDLTPITHNLIGKGL